MFPSFEPLDSLYRYVLWAVMSPDFFQISNQWIERCEKQYAYPGWSVPKWDNPKFWQESIIIIALYLLLSDKYYQWYYL